ncbi:MAG: 3-hydroxyacyl-CoA dehydrogenase NAD-binding domain-containing protein [Planctomycetota bacterium]
MDLTGFPFPEDAPPVGACINVERPESGLAVVRFMSPHRSFPVLDAPLLRDLDLVVTELERDKALRGVVFAGRRVDQFLAGADVEAISKITNEGVVKRAVRAVHDLFGRIMRLQATTVAAVGGPVPGGAYELSLACDWIVATDDDKTRIGLPETQLGIIPGWGGSHRLPWRIGVPAALDIILAGKLERASKALRIGMIDRLTKPAYLERVAADIAMGRERLKRRKRGVKGYFVDRSPATKAVIHWKAKEQLDAKARGLYPAVYKALDIVMAAPGKTIGEAALIEADALAELATGAVCKNLVSIFFASEAAKKAGKLADGSEPKPVQVGAVVGGGVMGAGIASLFAERGLTTRLADLSQTALDAAIAGHVADVKKKLQRRQLTPAKATAAIDRLDGSPGIIGMGTADIGLEAVAEVMTVKKKVLAQLAAALPKDAILATNTSSLSVTEMQADVPHPERVVGMHFFNPVKKMPLVEIVRGERTSEATIARTAALALRLGKTPVVTRDVPGFLVNRILGPYLDEAVRLFVGGASPKRVDRLMLQFGMPMGPFRLLDEVGLDIAVHAAKSLHAGYGDRMQPCDALDAFMGKPGTPTDRRGKKSGKGFYVYSAAAASGREEPELADDLGRFQKATWGFGLSDREIVERCVLAMLNEAARCFEERVVATAQELDLATVFGTGFAPFRGGILRYCDARGARDVVGALEAIHGEPDVHERGAAAARFAPAQVLRDLAANQGRFHPVLAAD